MNTIGTGIYPILQTARLVAVEPRAIWRWLQGYLHKYKGGTVCSNPLWKTQLRDEGLPDKVIGFRDLLELRMVAAFVRHGVGRKVIRATVDAAARNFGANHPLINQTANS